VEFTPTHLCELLVGLTDVNLLRSHPCCRPAAHAWFPAARHGFTTKPCPPARTGSAGETFRTSGHELAEHEGERADLARDERVTSHGEVSATCDGGAGNWKASPTCRQTCWTAASRSATPNTGLNTLSPRSPRSSQSSTPSTVENCSTLD